MLTLKFILLLITLMCANNVSHYKKPSPRYWYQEPQQDTVFYPIDSAQFEKAHPLWPHDAEYIIKELCRN